MHELRQTNGRTNAEALLTSSPTAPTRRIHVDQKPRSRLASNERRLETRIGHTCAGDLDELSENSQFVPLSVAQRATTGSSGVRRRQMLPSAAGMLTTKAAEGSSRHEGDGDPGYGNCGHDMSGGKHDLKELRELRNVAVVKGIKNMAKFFTAKGCAALYEVGDDAPAIFFECWYTSSNSSIRCMSKDVYKRLMPIFEERLLWLTSEMTAPMPLPPPPARRRTRDFPTSASQQISPMPLPPAPARRRTRALPASASQPKTGRAAATAAEGKLPDTEHRAMIHAATQKEGAALGNDGSSVTGDVSTNRATSDPDPSKFLASAVSAARADTGAPRKGCACREPGTRPDRDDFFAFMFLVRCKHEMGEDTDALLHRGDVAWSRNGLANTNKLFGYSVESLRAIPVSDWLIFLMRVMIMELNQLLFRGRYPLQWGLREALTALRSVELTPPPKCDSGDHDAYMRFHHSFYLATHIVYVQSAYNSIRASQLEIPWLYRYIRVSFRFLLKRARAKFKGKDVYLDVDGVAEVIDCLRGAGLTEASDKMVCEGTLLLLRLQQPNGSWPVWLPGYDCPERDLDTYHRVHPTWVCTQALRDRDFRIAGNEGNHIWSTFIPKLLADINFKELAYQPDW